MEGKHVDALHAQDEELRGFGGWEDKKHLEKEGHPAERKTALKYEEIGAELV